MYLHKSDLVKQTAKVNNNGKIAFILKNLQEVVYTLYIHCMCSVHANAGLEYRIKI